ncbi:hypothetical protein DH86_00001786, partial [Scytalidium sp. 3C]
QTGRPDQEAVACADESHYITERRSIFQTRGVPNFRGVTYESIDLGSLLNSSAYQLYHTIATRVFTSTPTMSSLQRAAPVSNRQSQVQTAPRIVSNAPRQAVLHLRGARDTEPSSSNGRRIRWAEDVVDNEGLGRKSSKVCCIYHAPHPIDESSDESSSSDSDSDSGDDGSARPSRKDNCSHNHNHKHGNGKAPGKRRPSPNAYEKIPKNRGSGGTTMKK